MAYPTIEKSLVRAGISSNLKDDQSLGGHFDWNSFEKELGVRSTSPMTDSTTRRGESSPITGRLSTILRNYFNLPKDCNPLTSQTDWAGENQNEEAMCSAVS